MLRSVFFTGLFLAMSLTIGCTSIPADLGSPGVNLAQGQIRLPDHPHASAATAMTAITSLLVTEQLEAAGYRKEREEGRSYGKHFNHTTFFRTLNRDAGADHVLEIRVLQSYWRGALISVHGTDADLQERLLNVIWEVATRVEDPLSGYGAWQMPEGLRTNAR